MEVSAAAGRGNGACEYGIYHCTIGRVIELRSIAKFSGSDLRLRASGCLRLFLNGRMAIRNHMTIYGENHIARPYGLRMAIRRMVRKPGGPVGVVARFGVRSFGLEFWVGVLGWSSGSEFWVGVLGRSLGGYTPFQYLGSNQS